LWGVAEPKRGKVRVMGRYNKHMGKIEHMGIKLPVLKVETELLSVKEC